MMSAAASSAVLRMPTAPTIDARLQPLQSTRMSARGGRCTLRAARTHALQSEQPHVRIKALRAATSAEKG